MEHNTGAGGVVVNKDRQVLLIANNRKNWGFPKGKIKKNEALIETARREIHEESGISDLTLIRELGSYQRTQLNPDGSENPNIIKTIHMFIFVTEELDLKPIDANIGEARWVDKNEVTKLLRHQKDKSFFSSVEDEI